MFKRVGAGLRVKRFLVFERQKKEENSNQATYIWCCVSVLFYKSFTRVNYTCKNGNGYNDFTHNDFTYNDLTYSDFTYNDFTYDDFTYSDFTYNDFTFR